MVWANTSRFSRKNVVKLRRQALIAGLMVVFVRPSGRPPSGQVRQVESVRRRRPRRSDRRCHDIATRLLARLFASPTPCLTSSEPMEAERSALCLPPRALRPPSPSPLHPCRLQLAHSAAVVAFSASTSRLSRWVLVELAFFFPASKRHCRRELRRAPVRSLLHFTLLHLAHSFPTISCT